MPTIVIASSKGGSGKSTSAILLATALAEHGATVTVIDADVNRPLSSWARHADKPNTLTVLSDVNETTIIDTIETAAAETQFVIVDLEGTASLMVGLAISRADLVIIPTQGSQLDATETGQDGAAGQGAGEIAAPQNPDGNPVHPHQHRHPAAHVAGDRRRVQKGRDPRLPKPDPRARRLQGYFLVRPDAFRPRPPVRSGMCRPRPQTPETSWSKSSACSKSKKRGLSAWRR